MRTFPRGRLVPRQPRAIKGTTCTELRGENIHGGGYIHWNIDIRLTLLHRYNICNGRYIHWDINTIPLALRIRIFVAANGLIRGDDIVDN